MQPPGPAPPPHPAWFPRSLSRHARTCTLRPCESRSRSVTISAPDFSRSRPAGANRAFPESSKRHSRATYAETATGRSPGSRLVPPGVRSPRPRPISSRPEPGRSGSTGGDRRRQGHLHRLPPRSGPDTKDWQGLPWSSSTACCRAEATSRARARPAGNAEARPSCFRRPGSLRPELGSSTHLRSSEYTSEYRGSARDPQAP